MDWSVDHVFSTLHVCWGAQAGLYRHFGIKKYPLEQKMFGVFPHRVLDPHSPILQRLRRGLPGPALPAHRGAGRRCAGTDGLTLLAESDEAGVYLAASAGRTATVRHRAPGVRPEHPQGRVRAGRRPGAAHRRAPQLLPRRRPDPAAGR